jgi:glycosyltransferase involved in cell wall biosynthesis
MQTTPRLSVIVPAHNAAGVLPRCLGALRRSDLPASAWELIVVDDASADGTGAAAEGIADRVIALSGGPHGPASARNRGSELARGSVIAFIDADVCVHPETLRGLLAALEEAPGVTAVFGAYDTVPTAPGLISRYRNLLHHYVHAQNAGDADTFWAGCGAIRREAFLRAGGFDERRYPRPQIEDIELGYRLREMDCRIVLRPDIQVTHLKRWTLRGIVRGDLLDRGVPWMHLLLSRQAIGRGSLNIKRREKFLTAAVAIAVLCLGAALVRNSPVWVGVAGVLLLLVVAANARLFRWFAALHGPLFAIGTVPLHLLYYLINAMAVVIALMQRLSGTVRDRNGERGFGTSVQRQIV